MTAAWRSRSTLKLDKDDSGIWTGGDGSRHHSDDSYGDLIDNEGSLPEAAPSGLLFTAPLRF